jgi:hypothetical protein
MSNSPLWPTAADTTLSTLLSAAKAQLTTAVRDRLMAQGGPPDLADPDRALDRLLTSAHREIGTAVAIRLEQQHNPAPSASDLLPEHPPRIADRGLKDRPASIRLRHRDQTRRMLARYWPSDLTTALRAALHILGPLSTLWDQDFPCTIPGDFADQVTARLDEVLRLPHPSSRATGRTPGYVRAAEDHLAPPAAELFVVVHSAKEMFEDELVPLLQAGAAIGDGGVSDVAQDLADDLERARRAADALVRARTEVEAASSDFTGADLRDAELEGVPLQGVRWDAATIWPALWEATVRRASLPQGDDGVLVIAAEPHDSAVPADA